jgi:hypothetical protein
MTMKDFQVARIVAMNAVSMSRLVGKPITIQVDDITLKAVPEDSSSDDVLVRCGIDPARMGHIEVTEPPMASDWKLSHPPGTFRASCDGSKHWIGTPDPKFKGESKTIESLRYEGEGW